MTGFTKLNYVNIGPHGTFKPSGNLHTRPEDIDAIFEHLSTTGADKLALHFHGGLVAENKGERIARNMRPVYTDGGAHAVTFIWETGLVETIWRNLTDINETKLFQKLIRMVFRQLTKRLGADISGRGPGEPMTLAKIEAELDKVEKFDGFDAVARGGAAQLDEDELDFIRDEIEEELRMELELDEEFQELSEDMFKEDPHLAPSVERSLRASAGRGPTLFQVAKFLAKVIYRVLKRYVRKRDHGLYPTVIEEILREFYLADFGSWVWGNMKDVAAEMWLPNPGPIEEASHPGRHFMEKLAAHQAQHPGFRVDLIGHSAGCIAICHMFHAAGAAGLGLDIRNVIFLAPACLTRLMHREIVLHPQRYLSFRMFTMSDDYETKDHLVPVVYTRSLLYLISGVLEDEADIPLAGLERHQTGEPPYADPYLVATSNFLKAAGGDRLVLSVTSAGAPGLESTSEKHGDFDNDPKTLDSLKHIISV